MREKELEESLRFYSALGVRKFETFTGWPAAGLHPGKGAAFYREFLDRFGMRFSSLHLPPVDENVGESVTRAVEITRLAAELGIPVVLFKAKSRELYIQAGKPYLDAANGLGVTPVLQNHAGSPISTLDDFREVIQGIADSRMKTLLETGHFHSAGEHWKDGFELLGDSIALVHFKDQIGGQSVPYGTGEIDLPGMFRCLESSGYQGDYVFEMEVKDEENTEKYIKEGLAYLKEKCFARI